MHAWAAALGGHCTVPLPVVVEEELLEMAALGLLVVESAHISVVADVGVAVVRSRPAGQKGFKLRLDGSKVCLDQGGGSGDGTAELGWERVGVQHGEVRCGPLHQQLPRSVPALRPFVKRRLCLNHMAHVMAAPRPSKIAPPVATARVERLASQCLRVAIETPLNWIHPNLTARATACMNTSKHTHAHMHVSARAAQPWTYPMCGAEILQTGGGAGRAAPHMA